MSDGDRTDHSDHRAGVVPPPASVTSEAVITAPEQQAALTSVKADTGSYQLQSMDLVQTKEAPNNKGAEGEGPKFVPPYYNLRYDYTEDPLQTGIGKLSLDFDQITGKMAKLLGKPEIESKHAFSLQNLKDTIEHPQLSKSFSESEIQSIRLMANQARRLLDIDMLPKFEPKMLQSGKLPTDQMYISKNSVNNQGKKLGVLRDA